MKHYFTLLCCFFIGLSQQTFGGSILGAELTYSTVAPNLYVITLKQVRDCSAILPANTYNLQLSSPGCGSLARTVVLNQIGSASLVPFYCPTSASNCAPLNQPGMALVYQHSATVTFSAPEVACSDWNMSLTITDDTRSATANVNGTPTLYLEAFVKLGTNINNSSVDFSFYKPAFSTAILNRTNHYNITIGEVDGDSIVYSMQPALQAPATPVTYQAPFTAQAPVVSNPASVFDAANGAFTFNPDVFVPNTLPAQGDNRYVAVFQVDEYRKINGVATRIGSVQRDMIFEIVQSDTAQRVPFFKNFTVDGLPFDTAQVVPLFVGQTTMVRFETDDLNTGDSLTFAPSPTGLPFRNITVTNNGIKPIIELELTPALQHSQAGIYYFPFRLEDDACPVAGITVGWLKFEVFGATGIRPGRENASGFTAFPNPFTESVHFKLKPGTKAESILIYNLLGQQIDEIQLKTVGSGPQKVQWQNANKHAVGTYFAQLVSRDKTIQTLKFTKVQ